MMAGDIIDLVSSSPPARRSQSIQASELPPSTQARSLQSGPALSTTAKGLELLSDTWLYSSDASETAEFVSSQQSRKRPRLSTLAGSNRLNRLSTAGLPAAQPIDLTSPGCGSRLSTATQPVNKTQTTAKSNKDAVCPQFSDPFGSSPPRAPKPRESAPIARSRLLPEDISSDPFGSSPAPAPTTAKTVEPTLLASSRTTYAAGTNGTRTRREVPVAWDPISSSIPESPLVQNKAPTVNRARSLSIISIGDTCSSGSEDDLPPLAQFDLSQPSASATTHTYTHTYSKPTTTSRSSKPATARTFARTTSLASGERAKKREERDASKAAEKEQKRREREGLKEQKRLEKEQAAAIAEVNKARTDRKVSAMEMITKLPTSLEAGLRVQVETFLEQMGVQYGSWESPVSNVICWKRKITSRFDDESGQWVPAPLRVEDENHIVKILTADELVTLALENKLDEDVQALQEKFTGKKTIYILEGVTTWMRKNRNLRNRQFTSNVRQETAAAPRRRNNQPIQEYIEEDIIEDAMLELQVQHGMLIHHTSIPLETAQWIASFTQHISTIPYKKQRDEATATARFCMDSGQVKTGEDNRDTYIRMLQEIFRVTAPIAYSVAGEFGSVTKLVNGLSEGGSKRLEAVHKSANKDGALSDRVIGPAISRRLHKIFTGTDEMSTDV